MDEKAAPSIEGAEYYAEGAVAVIDNDYILQNTEIKELLNSVDSIIDITSESVDVAFKLEKSLRDIRSDNSSLMRALTSFSKSRRLEEIQKLSLQPQYFSETLLTRVMDVIKLYDELREKQKNEYNKLNEVLKKKRQEITNLSMNGKEHDSAFARTMGKVRGAMVFTTQLIFEFVHGITTGNLAGLVSFLSDHQWEKGNRKSAMKRLRKSANDTEELRGYVLSIQTKALVVQEFKDIQNHVLALNNKLNLMGKSAVEALKWKGEEGGARIYDDIVNDIKKRGKDVGCHSDKLEKQIADWKNKVHAARSGITDQDLPRIKKLTIS